MKIIIHLINYNLNLSPIQEKDQNYRLSEREAITNGFKEALLILMEENDYNSKIIFNSQSNKFYEKIFKVEDLNDKFRQINKNLEKTIQHLP